MGWLDTVITIVVFVVIGLWLLKLFKPMFSGIWDPISERFERMKENRENKREKNVSITYE